MNIAADCSIFLTVHTACAYGAAGSLAERIEKGTGEMRWCEQGHRVSPGFLSGWFCRIRGCQHIQQRFTGSSAGNFALCSGLMEDKVEKEKSEIQR
jgi:hypothetical protein